MRFVEFHRNPDNKIIAVSSELAILPSEIEGHESIFIVGFNAQIQVKEDYATVKALLESL